MFSRESVSRFWRDLLGPGRHRYHDFEMPFDLEPNPADPVRSWTFKDEHGNRRFTNGLSLLMDLAVLEVTA
jgi:hypothetical protein